MCARGSVVQACGDCECVLEGVWCVETVNVY